MYGGAVVLALGITSAVWAAGGVERGARQESLPGAWVVESRSGGEVLLVRKPVAERGPREESPRAGGTERALPPEPAIETAIWARGAISRRQTASPVPVSLPGQDRPVSARSVAFGGRQVLFAPVGAGRIHPAPGGQDRYVIVRGDELWLTSAGGSPRRLTKDNVGGFDRAALRARASQAPDSYLLWAESPMWSPEGNLVAFVTNREAIAAGNGSGQSVWVVDPATGAERPLLAGTREAFIPVGWLGEELLVATDGGALTAVNPGTGARRDVGRGVPIAVADSAPRAAVAEFPQPGRASITVLSGDERITVPPPPAGFGYGADAFFSPSGASLVIVAAADDGRRQLVVFDVAGRRTSTINLPDVPARVTPTDPPQWLDEQTLLLNVVDNATRQARALVLPVPAQ
ncbi:MAG TPA: hypothetical protein VHG28_21940 [Longimicrobiaceae bacterium]|nr:hypothetical protein [Longimicrobiaceae bacterium]